MKNEFIRTGKTKLSDDELILFDAIFDCNCSLNLLKRKRFQEVFNLGYEHNLSDKNLEICVKDLQSRKLIRIKEINENNGITQNVSLIAKGGKLWEKEREPIWEKYCEGWTYSPFKEENKMLMEVVSPSLQALNNYLKVSKELNYGGLTDNHEITFIVEKRKFIVGMNWKRFEELHTAIITGIYNENYFVDWNKYYEYLDWWGNVHELNLLKTNIG